MFSLREPKKYICWEINEILLWLQCCLSSISLPKEFALFGRKSKWENFSRLSKEFALFGVNQNERNLCERTFSLKMKKNTILCYYGKRNIVEDSQQLQASNFSCHFLSVKYIGVVNFSCNWRVEYNKCLVFWCLMCMT